MKSKLEQKVEPRKGRGISVDKYDRIIDVAYEMFPAKGFSATKMEDIAKQAGVSKQTIFNRFETKDKLFCEVIEGICRRHCPSEILLHDKTATPTKILSAIGNGFLAMISSPKGVAFHRLVMNESHTKPKIGKFFFDFGPLKMQQLLVDYLNRNVALGIFEIPDTEKASNQFFALLKGRFHLRVALRVKPAPAKSEIKEHIDETVSIFLKLYLHQKHSSPVSRRA